MALTPDADILLPAVARLSERIAKSKGQSHSLFLIYLVDTNSGSYTTGVLINIHTAARAVSGQVFAFVARKPNLCYVITQVYSRSEAMDAHVLQRWMDIHGLQ